MESLLEEALLLCGEQLIAPGKRVAQGLLPKRKIACASCQDLQSTVQSGEQCLWWEQLDAGCRQFDGQWQPVEPETDLGNGRGIVRCHVEIGLDGLRSLEEQVHRGNVWQRLCIGVLPWIGEREGWDDELLFATQAQHLSTRDQGS